MISSVRSPYSQQPSLRPETPADTASGQELPAVQAQAAGVTDTVTFSPTAKSLQADQQETQSAQGTEDERTQGTEEENLDEAEKRQVDQLKKRDQEVKAHERAHMAAGGGLVQGGASYTYQRGPDGGMYAVGGEVSIDTSSENDPDQTIQKMEQVKRAALAPAQPSGTDRAVAAQAAQIQLQAQMQKAQESREAEENPEEDAVAVEESVKVSGENDNSGAEESLSVNSTQALGEADTQSQNEPWALNFDLQAGRVGNSGRDDVEVDLLPSDEASRQRSVVNPYYVNFNQDLFVGQQINISV